MRKDVKWALLLWPGLAAATITLLSGWSVPTDSTIPPTDPTSIRRASLSRIGAFAAEVTEDDPFVRCEQGRRAVALPRRVAAVLDTVQESPRARRGHDKFGGAAANVPLSDLKSFNALQHREEPFRITTNPIPSVEPVIELTLPASVLPKSNRVHAKAEFPKQTIHRPQVSGSLSPTSNESESIDQEVLRSRSARTVRSASAQGTAWPATSALESQLERLSELARDYEPAYRQTFVSTAPLHTELDQWSRDVAASLQRLRQLPRLGHPQAKELIERLASLGQVGVSQAELVRDRDLQVDWLRTAHGVRRRTAVWQPVWELSSGSATPVQNVPASSDSDQHPEQIAESIDQVRAELHLTGDATGWQRFLLLDQIETAAFSQNPAERSEVALQFLTRLNSPLLHDTHRQWLMRESFAALQQQLKPWVIKVVDYPRLLRQLESHESGTTGRSAAHIAEAVQALRFCDQPVAESVADAIDVYYRNANIRLAISQKMLQRLIPDAPPQTVPVRTRMYGSRIRGTSQIDSDLHVVLIPSSAQWQMQLQTTGTVHTRSRGYRGPIVMRTLGSNGFEVTTPISVSPRGIEIGQSEAQAHGRVRLQKVESDFDGIPLVGSMVRGYAERKFKDIAPESNHRTNHRIATEVENQVDDQLNEQVARATDQFSSLVLGPLGRLQLDPTVTDMQTTEQRLIARYRLASNRQLAACTARPRAPSNSLFSLQVHQSAINNTLARLVPQQQPTGIHEAIASALGTFGGTDIQLPSDIPEDVTIQFLPEQPISVEFQDSVAWVTMRVVRLTRRDRLQLTKFVVRAAYRPEVNRTSAELVRDGHLSISGPGMSMRERLPIRAIFNKILSSSRPLPLTLPAMAEHPAMEGLEINQLVIDNGWIGLAVAPAHQQVADRAATARERR